MITAIMTTAIIAKATSGVKVRAELLGVGEGVEVGDEVGLGLGADEGEGEGEGVSDA